MKAKPVHEVRIGAVKAAIWKNETETGPRHNVTFRPLYKDGDQWQSSDSFGRDDLLLVAKVADRAHSWICAQPQDKNGSVPPSVPQTMTVKFGPNCHPGPEQTTADSEDA